MLCRYVHDSLNKTVMQPADATSSSPPLFHGLPVSILLASQAGLDHEVNMCLMKLLWTISVRMRIIFQIAKLRSEGENLAASLGCPFIDVMEPEYAYNRRFHESQIRRAMRSLINGIKERAGSSRNSRTTIEITESNVDPDIRIIACTMAGKDTG